MIVCARRPQIVRYSWRKSLSNGGLERDGLATALTTS